MNDLRFRLLLSLSCAAVVYAQGIITTVAGGDITYPGNSFPTNSASFGELTGVAVHPITGEVYFASSSRSMILKLNPVTNNVSIVAGIGIGAFSGDGGPAANAALSNPWQIAFDKTGSLYIADLGNSRIRRIDPQGMITTASSKVGAVGLAVAADGSPYAYWSSRIYRINADGTSTVIAGTGRAGYSGDGGPAVQAMIGNVQSLAFDKSGNLLLADNTNNRLRRITMDGVISTFAGNGVSGRPVNGPATSSPLSSPGGLAVDSLGNALLIAGGRLVKVDGNGVLTILNPNASTYFLTSPGIIAKAQFAGVMLAFDPAGNLYLTDFVAGYLYRIAPSGLTQVIAAYAPSFGIGDKGPALSAGLSGPVGLAFLPDGSLLITDSFHQRVRRLSPSGTIDTFAGTGSPAT